MAGHIMYEAGHSAICPGYQCNLSRVTSGKGNNGTQAYTGGY